MGTNRPLPVATVRRSHPSGKRNVESSRGGRKDDRSLAGIFERQDGDRLCSEVKFAQGAGEVRSETKLQTLPGPSHFLTDYDLCHAE